MKRWTSTWAALLVAGFLAVPGTGFAQTPAAPAQTPSAPAASATTTPDKAEQGTPQEHLQKADAALNSISPTAVNGKAKGQIADVKKRVTALEKMTAKNTAGAAATADSAKSAANWSKEAAAADKILGELLADTSATGAASASATATATAPMEPKPAGTSGSMPSKAPAAGLDEDTKAKLATVRASLTAFAAAMSGSASSPAPAAKTSPSTEPAAASTTASPSPATAPPTAQPAAPTSPATPPAEPAPTTSPATPPAEPAPTSPPSTPSPSPQPTTQPPAQPAEPTTPAQPPTQPAEPAAPAQPPTSTTQAPTDPATAQAKTDADGAKRALTAARDSLAQMTQLPAAQQLTGESRTQVTQLISSFNELITTNTDWKASYAKVDGILTSLIGASAADESTAAPTATPPAAAPPAATPPAAANPATPGAVGTSGTTSATLDPGVKAKLVEFRTHLKEFEKAAGADKK